MKIGEIHNLFTQKGIEADFRGREGVQKLLDRKKKTFDSLSSEQREDFDQEALQNPYMDSGVFNVYEDKEIKRVLVGIDIEPAEILLAKQLGDIDLAIAHHPEGRGLAQLADVMHLQADVLSQYGVPINIAESLMKVRISEVARGVNAINHQRTIDMAKILGVNLMVAHTSADNMAAKFVKNLIEEKKPEYVGDILKILKALPEYKESMKIGVGPKVFVGSSDNRAGKIAVTEFTGGTEGSTKMYEKMAQAGIGTVIAMHTSEEHRREAESAHINIVIAGHMSSDSLGMNLLCDELQKRGIEIVPCSGFIRFSRV
ncbi:MAG: NGG1p interacting factor NIF3 [Candidatus Staskawiczbacteria bacterium]|nr:NGG1p interacting factor NIF3 [Candidatus Staskawiczbacteria bacterium]